MVTINVKNRIISLGHKCWGDASGGEGTYGAEMFVTVINVGKTVFNK